MPELFEVIVSFVAAWGAILGFSCAVAYLIQRALPGDLE